MSESSRPIESKGPLCALLLRPWTESDATALREAIDEDVSHITPWLSWSLDEPVSLEHTRLRLRGYVEQFRTGRGYRYAITPLERPSVILGGAHLNCRFGPAAHDVGYWVRKSATRQGIARAAVAALVVHAFDERQVDRLVIQCDIPNTMSAGFARSMGFQFLGTATATHPNGQPRPLLQFEMTRASYLQRHAATMKERARRVQLVAGTAVAHGGSSPVRGDN